MSLLFAHLALLVAQSPATPQPADEQQANILLLNSDFGAEGAFRDQLTKRYPCILSHEGGETQSLETLERHLRNILPKLANPLERRSLGVKATPGCAQEFSVDIRHVWDAKTLTLWAAAGATLNRKKLPDYVAKLYEESVRGQFLVEALQGNITASRQISLCPDSGCTLFHRFWVNNILSRDLLDRLGKLGNSVGPEENTKLRISHVNTVIHAYLNPEKPFVLEHEKESALARCKTSELRYSPVEPNNPWTLLCGRSNDILALRINPDPNGMLQIVHEEIPKRCDDVQLVNVTPAQAVQIAPGLAVVYSNQVNTPLDMTSDKCAHELTREKRIWKVTDLGLQINSSWIKPGHPDKVPPTIICVHPEDVRKLYSVNVESTYETRTGHGVKRLKVHVAIAKRYHEQPGFVLEPPLAPTCKILESRSDIECDVPRESFQEGAEWALRQIQMTIPLPLCNSAPSAGP